ASISADEDVPGAEVEVPHVARVRVLEGPEERHQQRADLWPGKPAAAPQERAQRGSARELLGHAERVVTRDELERRDDPFVLERAGAGELAPELRAGLGDERRRAQLQRDLAARALVAGAVDAAGATAAEQPQDAPARRDELPRAPFARSREVQGEPAVAH